MSARRSSLLGTALIVVGSSVVDPQSANAEPPVDVRSRLVYAAPAACPNAKHFVAQLTHHSDVVIDESAPITLDVRIRKEGPRHRGRIALLGATQEGDREVVADRCEDVVRGLALFSAIALESYFEHRPQTESQSSSNAARADAPSPAVPSPLPTAAPRLSVGPPQESPHTRSPSTAPPVAARSANTPRWFVGFGAGEQSTAGTRALHFVSASGGIELPPPLRVSMRVAANVGGVVPQSYLDGTLSFASAWLRLEVCPGWVGFDRTIRASLCPVGDVGVQRAALDGRTAGETQARPWLALGALLRLHTRLSPKAELTISGGAVAPLLAVDFPTRAGLAYRTPTLAPVVGVDVFFSAF